MSQQALIDVVGYAAAILTPVAFAPQILKTMRTKDTHAISLRTWSLITVAEILWIGYGLGIKNPQILITNIPILVMSIVMVVYKTKYR